MARKEDHSTRLLPLNNDDVTANPIAAAAAAAADTALERVLSRELPAIGQDAVDDWFHQLLRPVQPK